MDKYRMPTEKKRIDSDVTELRTDTEHPSNECETEANRTM